MRNRNWGQQCKEIASQSPRPSAAHCVIVSKYCISHIATSLVILLVAALLAGCRAGDVPPVFKIALIAPFEGPSRPLGYNVLAAVHLRLQAWNEAGETPRLELLALNDNGDPALAAELAAQLALDPDVIAVIGPPQGPTALSAAPALAAQGLPTLLLAPISDPPSSPVIAFGGLAVDVQAALKGYAPEAAPQYQGWPAQPALWLGDPLTLAAILRQAPELAPSAGAVAAEDAFAAWACPERLLDLAEDLPCR